MNDLITNCIKLRNVRLEIERLSNPNTYYFSNYPPQALADKRNRQHLKKAIKSYKRLIVVVKKQSQEFNKQVQNYTNALKAIINLR